MDERVMSVRAVGEHIDGRLPLSEVARISGNLQATLERLAMAIRGREHGRGRRPADVVDAVRLELTGFRSGSVVLEASPADDALIDHQLLRDSTNLFFEGLASIGERKDRLRPEFSPQVLDGLLQLAGGIGPSAVDHLEFSYGSRNVRVDAAWRDHVRHLRKQRTQDVLSIIGRLHEGDFDPLNLRCRIDTVEATIQCSFTRDMRERVLAAMDAMVAASGIAEFDAGGRIRSLDIDDLTILDEAQRQSISELADEQGIAPVRDITDFATMTDLGDSDFDEFMTNVLSAR